MVTSDEFTHALQETTIARRISIPHDEARAQYRLSRNTSGTWPVFEEDIVNYYAYHYGRCVAPGAHLSRTEALGQAKEIIEREYRRRRSDIVGAFADARDGTNNGLRGVLDAIADGLKAESTDRYVRDVFDSRVAPNDFETQVVLIRDFIERFGAQLGDSIQRNRPERYARDYRALIEAFVNGLRQISSMFRRL